MAQSHLQRSRIRKLSYLGVIIALFTVALLHRQFIIEPQAVSIKLRERTQGKVELTSSAVRLAMFGSRGMATAFLWQTALERQKKHQWNELELVINSITTLQPKFVTPWLYQSWNLAFNVSVECDRVRDKYFYISRGLQLLAKGEEKHEGYELGDGKRFPGNPDMRYYLASYYKRKIGTGDDRDAMFCLLEMSCLPPSQRNPRDFRKMDKLGRTVVNLKKFEEFCKKHPRMVRRLKRRVHCTRPEDVIAFLEKNFDIPNRFKAQESAEGGTVRDLKERLEQFPVLPPWRKVKRGDRELVSKYDVVDLDREEESFDVFIAARSWHIYAEEPLPPLSNPPLLEVNEPPVDLLYNRIPKMTTFLFRSAAARTQEYAAEALQNEGWFDADGWRIRDWFEDLHRQRGTLDVTRIGQERKYHSRAAWEKSFAMYEKYGRDLGLILDQERHKRMLEQQKPFTKKYMEKRQGESLSKRQVELLDPAMKKSRDAYLRLYNRSYMIQTANFNGHYDQCRIEKRPEVAGVRKMFFEAREALGRAEATTIIGQYRDALTLWLPILLRHKEFRNLNSVLRETCQEEHRYLGLLEDQFENKSVFEEPHLFYMGMARFGNIYTPFALPGSNLPALTYLNPKSSWLRSRIFPLREVTGPYEWIYLYEPRPLERKPEIPPPPQLDMSTVLLGLTRGANPVPFAVSPLQADSTIVAVHTGFRFRVNPALWQPLIPEEVLRQARSDVLYERRLRKK